MNNADFENLNSIDFYELLAQARSGCDKAKSKMIDRMHGYVTDAANRQKLEQLKHKFGASDIVQLTMLEVYRNFDSFKGSTEGEWTAWVRAIAANQVKQTQRDLGRQKRNAFKEVSGNDTRNLAAGLIDHQLTPQSDAIAKENQKRMAAAIEQLPDDHRQVIQLRSLQRKPFKEVAQVMKRSEDAVTKLWSRAITKLQEQLKHDDESTA